MSNIIKQWFDDKNLSQFRDISNMEYTFDRLFKEFSDWKKQNGNQSFGFSPSCEIVEEDRNYVMKFDLPGIPKDQVKIEVDGDQLTVRAERKEEKKKESKKKYLAEVIYGSYLRSFTLPAPIDEKKVDAKFENGVLTVTVPKTESVRAKEISIQ